MEENNFEQNTIDSISTTESFENLNEEELESEGVEE